MTVEAVDALALTEIASWLQKRGTGPLHRDRVPPTGVWVPYTACVFFYHTQSSVTYVDSLISNPESDPRSVHRAVTQLAEHAVKVNKGKLLLFYSQNKGVCAILNRVVGPSFGRNGQFFAREV